MRSAVARIAIGALVTAVAATLVWAIAGDPPAATIAPGDGVTGQGWELSAAELTTTDSGPDGAAPEGTSYVVLSFVLTAREPIAPDQLGCSVEFRAGRLSWRPDNTALPLESWSGCYGLQPGPNRLAYSVTVPSVLAADVVAEVTVVPGGESGELRWFGGESVLRIAR